MPPSMQESAARGESGEDHPPCAPLPPDALYIHVPFCLRKCAYCDFHSVPLGIESETDYIEALLCEVRAVSESLRFRTVYIGGGTPTSLSSVMFSRLLAGIDGRLGAGSSPPVEYTIETNPATLEREKITALEASSVNRISVGIQTFNKAGLAVLGRAHDAAQAVSAVRLLRNAGFGNLNLDMLFGWPGQTIEMLREDLGKFLDLRPEHVSAYCLSVEHGTPLARAIRDGSLQPLSDDAQADMLDEVVETMESGGYRRYEVSNFAQPGRESLHNRAYWENRPYVGCGSGACSYANGTRTENTRDIQKYILAISRGERPMENSETLSPEKSARETLVMGLRMTEGINLHEFNKRTGFDALVLCADAISGHVAAGRLEILDGRLRLTRQGFQVANRIWSDLV